MIHVVPQPEPASFDRNVRQKGLAWLQKKGIALNQPLPPGVNIHSYWGKECLDELYSTYGGHCAYLAVFIERVVGSPTVDHFIPKSQRVDLAYEWANYRLACSRMNSRKGNYSDVLDPFEIETGWVHLELITGHIYPSEELPPLRKEAVQATINRLRLDDCMSRDLRTQHYDEYLKEGRNANRLKRLSPFVWSEAQRQGLL